MEKTHNTSDISSDLAQSCRADRPSVFYRSAEEILFSRSIVARQREMRDTRGRRRREERRNWTQKKIEGSRQRKVN